MITVAVITWWLNGQSIRRDVAAMEQQLRAMRADLAERRAVTLPRLWGDMVIYPDPNRDHTALLDAIRNTPAPKETL